MSDNPGSPKVAMVDSGHGGAPADEFHGVRYPDLKDKVVFRKLSR